MQIQTFLSILIKCKSKNLKAFQSNANPNILKHFNQMQIQTF